MDKVLHSSVKHDWQTPESFLGLVRQVGPIALDPCTSADNPTLARQFCSPDGRSGDIGFASWDGLSCSWHLTKGNGLTFVNPPYGRSLPDWMTKCRVEAYLGCEIIALVPARPGAKWWQRTFEDATATLLWRGRIKFKGATAGAPFDSTVFYFGDRVSGFMDAFAGCGLFARFEG